MRDDDLFFMFLWFVFVGFVTWLLGLAIKREPESRVYKSLCRAAGCFAETPWNSNYCPHHQCSLCYEGAVVGGYCRACAPLRCRSQGCTARRPLNSDFREHHQCARCYDRAAFGRFCREHVCQRSGCLGEKPRNSNYCPGHQCVSCYEEAVVGRYCRACAPLRCKSQGCTAPRPMNSDYCKQHQCARCYKKAVNGEYCQEHLQGVLVMDEVGSCGDRHRLPTCALQAATVSFSRRTFLDSISRVKVDEQVIFEFQKYGFLQTRQWVPKHPFHKIFPCGSQVNRYESTVRVHSWHDLCVRGESAHAFGRMGSTLREVWPAGCVPMVVHSENASCLREAAGLVTRSSGAGTRHSEREQIGQPRVMGGLLQHVA
ncbi:unnamed protein product [Prorocentrum cordatum]|uniref:Uncharacterized protein n=1 Tax=Prorocentrum cordatum TaxID=2364126 RepID=A0ABN9QXN0_9DINO|nr:unnamed protein product [Polarella glacialis]